MTEDRIAALEAQIARLQDRQAILDVIMREARGRDRQDEALTASCYWDEGFDEHGPMICPAPKYPRRANAGHAAFFSMTSHNITNHNCEIDGDVATAESYVMGGLLSKDEGACTVAMGRYVDRLERRGGEWRILHRRTVIDMAYEGSAEWLQTEAVKGFLKGVWTKDDPSYQRPVAVGNDRERW